MSSAVKTEQTRVEVEMDPSRGCKYPKGRLSRLLSRKEHKMALSQEDINESEIAKNYVMNSDLDEDYKTNLVDLINTSLIATNGISPEEKIQRMTNSIQKLAVSQVGLIKSIKSILEEQLQKMSKNIDDKIVSAINEANSKKCKNCKAMTHAEQVEKEEERKRIISEFLQTSGLKNAEGEEKKEGVVQKEELTPSYLVNRLFGLLEKPYVYVFASIAVISPFGLDMLKMILQYFGKGS